MPSLQKPLILVGLMGAGKSTVGRKLAESLGVPFKDSDSEIEEAAGCSIQDLFAMYGEDIFRDLEQRVIKRLLKEKNLVLATGGGSFMQPAVREELSKRGLTLWLSADLPVLLERVNRRDNRPLLATGNKKRILARLIKERYPVYAQAHITIDSNDGPHEKVVKRILTTLHARNDVFHDA